MPTDISIGVQANHSDVTPTSRHRQSTRRHHEAHTHHCYFATFGLRTQCGPCVLQWRCWDDGSRDLPQIKQHLRAPQSTKRSSYCFPNDRCARPCHHGNQLTSPNLSEVHYWVYNGPDYLDDALTGLKQDLGPTSRCPWNLIS